MFSFFGAAMQIRMFFRSRSWTAANISSTICFVVRFNVVEDVP
jgi:hypothetical protein